MRSRVRRGSRPEVTLENYAAAYDFYGPARRRDTFTHPLMRFIDFVWAPRVDIAPDVVAEIHRLHAAGIGVVVAANHPSGHDALVLPGAMWDKRIRFLVGGTGLAKDSLFSGPTRPLFEYTGTIPVFRAKNYPDVLAEVHIAAAARMIEVCSDRLGEGGVVLSFVEGTNSAPEDLRALRPESVKRGVGEIVHGCLAAGHPVALLPVGIVYRGRERATMPPRRATVTAGPPVLWEVAKRVPTVDEIRATAGVAINAALAEAWGD